MVTEDSSNQSIVDDSQSGAQVEQNNSVDSEESEISKESETLDDAKDSSESDADGTQDDESQETEEDEEKDSDKKSDLPKGFKKRIGRLTRQRQEAKQEAEYWKREALKQHREPAPLEEESDSRSTAKVSDDKPRLENFDSHEEWIDALTDWKVEQKDRAKEAKSKEAQAKSAYQEQISKHNERIAQFREKNPEFDDVISEFVEENGDVSFSSSLEQALIESDLGPALILELAKNPKELERINSLGVVACAREIGKIEAKLSQKVASSELSKSITTKAPVPPTPVGGKSERAVKKSIYDPGLSFTEYERLRIEQLKQKES